jgi:hypothetical protein
MNGRIAKKIRKELRGKMGAALRAEKTKVAKEFKDFINKLDFWTRLKLCREIMRRKF